MEDDKQIYQWEDGDVIPRPNTLKEICRVLTLDEPTTQRLLELRARAKREQRQQGGQAHTLQHLHDAVARELGQERLITFRRDEDWRAATQPVVREEIRRGRELETLGRVWLAADAIKPVWEAMRPVPELIEEAYDAGKLYGEVLRALGRYEESAQVFVVLRRLAERLGLARVLDVLHSLMLSEAGPDSDQLERGGRQLDRLSDARQKLLQRAAPASCPVRRIGVHEVARERVRFSITHLLATGDREPLSDSVSALKDANNAVDDGRLVAMGEEILARAYIGLNDLDTAEQVLSAAAVATIAPTVFDTAKRLRTRAWLAGRRGRMAEATSLLADHASLCRQYDLVDYQYNADRVARSLGLPSSTWTEVMLMH